MKTKQHSCKILTSVDSTLISPELHWIWCIENDRGDKYRYLLSDTLDPIRMQIFLY
jgi:hypothetical protein